MAAEAELTLADRDAFLRFQKRAAKRIGRRAWESAWVWCLAVGIALAFLAVAYGFGSIVYVLAATTAEVFAELWQGYRPVITYPLFLLVLFVLYMFPVLRDWPPYNRDLAVSAVFKPSQMKLSDDGVQWHGEAVRTECSWSAVLSAHELPKHFVLTVDRVNGIVVPKRCLADEAELADLREILERHLGGRAHMDNPAGRKDRSGGSPVSFPVELQTKDIEALDRVLRREAPKILPQPGERGRLSLTAIVASIFYLAFLWASWEFASFWHEEIMHGLDTTLLICLAAALYFATELYVKVLRGSYRRPDPVPGGAFLNRWRYTFDREGLSANGPGIGDWYGWAAFLAAFETADHFFLMIDRMRGIVMPKRAFAGPGELDSLRNVVTRAVGEIRNA